MGRTSLIHTNPHIVRELRCRKSDIPAFAGMIGWKIFEGLLDAMFFV